MLEQIDNAFRVVKTRAMKNKIFVLALTSLSSFSAFAKKSTKSADATAPTATAAPAPAAPKVSEEDREILDKGEMPMGRYIAGGVVGTAVGFGIGHAIEGRYAFPGWIFTAGETISWITLAVGLSKCTTTTTYSSTYGYSDTRDCGGGAKAAIIIGATALVGLRIWEILDVWLVPMAQNERYHAAEKRSNLSFYALPPLDKSPFQVGMNLRF